MTSRAILGRDAEVRLLEAFLDEVTGGRAGVVVLSGSAGVGKTTLWSTGVDSARRRGFRVAVARPTEVETGLSFAALGDLLGPFLDAAMPELPEPQRVALDAALLRAPVDRPPHPLGVSLGTLQVLRAASAAGPILVAVDDGPWLDEASARAIEFAIRRVTTEPIGFLVARRTTAGDEPLPAWLATAPDDRLRRIEVGPMSIDEIGALLRDRLALALTRPVLARLHAISGGTPFYALELGRDLQQRGAWRSPEALETPRALDRLVGERIAALSPGADVLTLHASALAQPTGPLLGAALGAEPARAGLAESEAAGILEVDGEAVRFSHPLLAAAAYHRARPDRRRAVHAHLATIVSDPEERARHLARSADGPDAAVADALDEAAGAAIRRGASEVAAELAAEAARLTPAADPAGRWRRQLVAAEHLVSAGDLHGADDALAALAEELPDGSWRADVLARRARIALYLTDRDRAASLLREASPIAKDDLGARIEIHGLLAGIGYLTWQDWRAARLEMREALRLARTSDDLGLRLQTLGHAATWQFALGRPWRPLVAEADALGVPIGAVPALEHPDLQFARLFSREGEPAEGRRRLAPLIEAARVAGDWTSLPRLLVSLVGVELDAGRWDHAARIAEEAETGLLQTGGGAYAIDLQIVQLDLAVLRGQAEGARAAGRSIDEATTGLPKPFVRTGPPLALAHLEVMLGNATAALEWIGRIRSEPGFGRLLPIRWETIVALETEALVALGRVAEARARIEPVARRAARRGPDAARAEADRALALALAADGEAERAASIGEVAVARYAALDLPYRTARAWFTLGEVRRRARRKSGARAAFGEARTRFAELGSPVWLERAEAEIGRVASRRPEGSRLTDTERRVAELAGSGHTNKEIADALFMSVHTVEAHLTRIFRTIGVQSRTELARIDLDRLPADGAD
jgi:DNA-binding CsgD family transcriptional regulator